MPWGLKDEGSSPEHGTYMGYKPSCPRCGGLRRKCKVKRAYYCRRCGYLPSGRHLGMSGEPVSLEERTARCERMAKLREQLAR